VTWKLGEQTRNVVGTVFKCPDMGGAGVGGDTSGTGSARISGVPHFLGLSVIIEGLHSDSVIRVLVCGSKATYRTIVQYITVATESRAGD
jgi:hypothetical protein